MGYNKNTQQHERTSSIPREGLLLLSQDERLGKKDLRVALVLLGTINGFGYLPSDYDDGKTPAKRRDPMNFVKVDYKAIAKNLHMKKKDIEKSIEHLTELDYIEWGRHQAVNDGIRWCF